MTDADSKLPLARIALIAATVFGFAATAVAQEIPEGQSCGGLVCDLGLFGHKTAPKATPAVPVPATATPVPPPLRTAATPETEARQSAHKKAHLAKAPVARAPVAKVPVVKAPIAQATARPATGSAAAAFNAPPLASSLMPAAPAPAAPLPVAPAPAAPALPPAFAAAPPPAPIPVTATPDEPVVLSNPYVYNKPLKFMFQSVDPSQGVQ